GLVECVAPVQARMRRLNGRDETRPAKAGSVTGAAAHGANHPARARSHGLMLAVVCGFKPNLN
ncbi:MAG: hypothetical protein Q7U80_11840, partial [Thiobacillus sp.]|nr:hypothetical protein [Thiobacillus sp.]